jgi:hypothetical protein
MWNLGLSDLAQKAKDAVALIESTINDSVGVGEEEEEDGGEVVLRGRERAPTSDGWEKCDMSSDHDSAGGVEKAKDPPPASSQHGMSFVDLKGAIDDIPKAEGVGKMGESDAALLDDALARIDSLVDQVTSLKDELVLAQAAKVLLEKQVKDLQEENRSLKMIVSSGN